MFTFRHIAVVFATLFLLPSVLGAVLAPRTSGTPQCQYKCPAYDERGNELENEMNTGPNIKCTYGHNPVRNCFYDRQVGPLCLCLRFLVTHPIYVGIEWITQVWKLFKVPGQSC